MADLSMATPATRMSKDMWLAAIVMCIATGMAFRIEEKGIPDTVGGPSYPQSYPMRALDVDPSVNTSRQKELDADRVSAVSAQDGWHKLPNASFHTVYGFIHTPKAAGSSFILDSTSAIPDGDGYYSQEHCPVQMLDELKAKCQGGLEGMFFELLVCLRVPRSHVYSQYLELKYDTHWNWAGKDNFTTEFPTITTFLDRFTSGPGAHHSDYPAYHPQDMQTRSLTCQTDNHGYHELSAEDLEMALESVKNYKFVGITEFYQASVCLFYDKANPGSPLPDFCDCQTATKWSSFPAHQISHDVPPHSLSDLSSADLEKMDTLTQMDLKVYRAGLKRFFAEVRELEERRGLRVHCQ